VLELAPHLREDIANMALFLASDEAEWITGVAMVVDRRVDGRARHLRRSAIWRRHVFG
jgi:NAD(P)-dependent dehydrogenase (short-subunit alcohol dehydrogenase family)